MIGISRLYCGTAEASDSLRYCNDPDEIKSDPLKFALKKRPVVVWNITRTCNLDCVHCYSRSGPRVYKDEFGTDECKRIIEDIASFGSPVILFSGGEPLMRKDIFDLGGFAVKSGLRVVMSTNGTLITEETADRLKLINISYVGISLDGMRDTHDRFRKKEGAFSGALRGIRLCRERGIKVGLRFTINKRNRNDIPGIFGLIGDEGIPRVCFYHLVYSGRASELIKDDLTHEESREAVDYIINQTAEFHKKGNPLEVLTVDNYSDAVYLYLKMKIEKHPRAEEALKLLRMNGGNGSGISISCISSSGEVHADQFFRHYSFGNLRKRKFSDIWLDMTDPLMRKLKNRKRFLKGDCASCRWLDICNGNLRVRAEAKCGDLWEKDPACYLTDEEIKG